MDEFRAETAKMELPDEEAGALVMLVQKICQVTEAKLGQMSKDLVAAKVKQLREVEEQVQKILNTEILQEVPSLLEASSDVSAMQQLLPAASSNECKTLHGHIKVLEVFAAEKTGVLAQLAPLNTIVPDDVQQLTMKPDVLTGARSMHCTLAAIQALCRPLRDGETRPGLARRARLMALSKQDVSLAPNLQLLLSQIAAEVPKVNTA